MTFEKNKLFIFEMANNHMGDLSHGIRIIHELRDITRNYDFDFGIKLQYRNLDTFIHPDYQDRVDIKYIDRFTSTRLSSDDFLTLRNEIKNCGFIPICTPFDEASVVRLVAHGFEILKIASASFTDWPLLERIAKTNLPIIASTAGATLEEIDQVVSFFSHRKKEFCLMHCVGEYPTPASHLELNQIDLFAKRYPNIHIGYSTHEDPNTIIPIKLAIAKGATVFEKHVGVETDKYKLNEYSATPSEIEEWLHSAKFAIKHLGVSNERRPISEKELADLNGLKRGVFAKTIIPEGESIIHKNTFYAIPPVSDQLLANDISPYTKYICKNSLQENDPVMWYDVISTDTRPIIFGAVGKAIEMLTSAKIALPNMLDLELSHHYGIEKIETKGAIIINCINREYCKKIIIVLPGQYHPIHYHKKKEESFQVLSGTLAMTLNKTIKSLSPGDMITVLRGEEHSFSSDKGAIFEEISTTHYKNDSYYDDASILDVKDRKTEITYHNNYKETLK